MNEHEVLEGSQRLQSLGISIASMSPILLEELSCSDSKVRPRVSFDTTFNVNSNSPVPFYYL